MKRVIGKLNTRTSDGRMIKALYAQSDPSEPIPVRVRTDPYGHTHVVGRATWAIEGDNIVADIMFKYGDKMRFRHEGVVFNFEILVPHMEIFALEYHHEEDGTVVVVDVGILKAIFFDDQPDAFGDLT